MPSGRQASKAAHITRGDIFDDLGLSPEEALEAKVKSDLWRDLLIHIEKRALNQGNLAHILRIHQPDASNLLRGKLSKFSAGKLIQFAVRLDLGVRVKLIESNKKPISKKSPTKSATKKGRELSYAGV